VANAEHVSGFMGQNLEAAAQNQGIGIVRLLTHAPE